MNENLRKVQASHDAFSNLHLIPQELAQEDILHKKIKLTSTSKLMNRKKNYISLINILTAQSRAIILAKSTTSTGV